MTLSGAAVVEGAATTPSAARARSSGFTNVVGQVEYLGGLECDVLAYAQIDATFFGSGGRIIATDIGNAAGLVALEPLPIT